MKKLIGRVINKVFVGKDNQSLWFVTDLGNIGYNATADCCSESYFSDVNRLKNILGHKVKEVKEVELMEEEYGNIPPDDYQQVYGWKIKTSIGEGLVVMRNESNGYYGGSAELSKGKMPENTLEVKKDFCSRDFYASK